MSIPSNYAQEVYMQGVQGIRPQLPTDLTVLEGAARARVAPEPFWYAAGAAGTGATARANRAAFDRWQILPRMLAGATERYTATTVLSSSMPSPVMLAPVGVQEIVHPDAEIAVAKAAAELNLTMVVSTVSSYSMEEIAAAAGTADRWFQLYWPNDKDICASLLQRAAAAGYSTLVLTLDTWLLGWRPHDLDQAYLPFLSGKGLANYFTDPVFLAGLERNPRDDLRAAIQRWMPIFTGTDHTWEEIEFVREHWSGPIVLKGIQHPDDARRAVDAGVDGIVVSNHGGRQVDGARGSLDCLPEVVAAAGDQLTVLFDSGIRTGPDIVKALSLGAQATFVGRPWVYGLALDGQAGVRHVLRSLLADFELTMALAGTARAEDLGPHVLRSSL